MQYRASLFLLAAVLFVALAASLRLASWHKAPAPQAAIPAKTRPASLAAGDRRLALTVDGLKRSSILHIPPAVATGGPLPLIIVLHGTYGTGRKMQVGLGFDHYADQLGFYVAYPDAYQEPGQRQTTRWNDGRGTLESSLQGIDDVRFIVSLVKEVATTVPLDDNRVFVTGASNGGMMTYRLGCETNGVFAGIAPVIANIPQPIFQSCNPQAPLNVLAINGDADPFIPFAGGEVCSATPSRLCEGGWVQSQAEPLATFAAANGCNPTPQSANLPVMVDDGTFIEQQTYINCAGTAQVTSYVVHNGGHTWPPHESQVRAGGQATANLDATQVIVSFFLP